MLESFIKIKKLLGGRGSGQFSSLIYGGGVDIAEYRQYSTGDEKRSINWKMSAKYDQLFVNLFHEEKAIDIHLCCDINFNRKQENNAELFAAFFAELVDYCGDKKAHIAGWLGKDALLHLEKPSQQLAFLEQCEARMKGLLPLYSSSLDELIDSQLMISKKRLIIFVSDFLGCVENHDSRLEFLRQKHEVLLVQIPTAEAIIAGVVSLQAFGL